MVSVTTARQIALSFPGTEENPHFDRAAFKVTGKRIFATMHETNKTVNVMLTPADQAEFCQLDAEAIYPVPNKWGLHGWTIFDLTKVGADVLSAALHTACMLVMEQKKKKK
jgi:predicted DNA-binding protein (MmcQ/YjbR family)